MLYALLLFIIAILLFGSSAIIGAIGSILGAVALILALALTATTLSMTFGWSMLTSYAVIFACGTTIGWLLFLAVRHFEKKRGLR